MSALFSTPKVNVTKAPDPVPPPTIDDAARNKVESDRLRRRRGLAGTLVTGPLGASLSPGVVQTKQLTGQ